MGLIYFPSCRFAAKYPLISEKIKQYAKKAFNADIADCCKPSLKTIQKTDTAVFICNSCAAFFRESSSAGNVISIWELMLRDTDFNYPLHTGMKAAVQDCWRAFDRKTQQDAVRKILNKMGVEALELERNYEKTKFCGVTLYEPLNEGYDKLAPKRYGTEAEGLFIEHTESEKQALMKEHCKNIPVKDVVCACVPCVNGINLGGKKAVHIAELVFGD